MSMNQAPSTRAAIGIDGIDALSGGGLPRSGVTLVLGTAGAGKTILSVQFLINGAERFGEPGIFVAFEETEEQFEAILRGLAGGEVPAGRDRLTFFPCKPLPDDLDNGRLDNREILRRLAETVEQTGAKRVVFDGLDAVLGLLFDPIAERRETMRIQNWIGEHGLCGIITGKAAEEGARPSRQVETMQFMCDSVLSLHHRLHRGLATRRMRFSKFRYAGCVGHEFPYVISDGGIQAPVFGATLLPAVRTVKHGERVSTGIADLDEMLAGGYFRGSSILIGGLPGTAKTTLAAAFVDAACRRGERALFIAFDERADEVARNLTSIALDLEGWRKAGLLRLVDRDAGAADTETHFVEIARYVGEHEPSCVVIDPISAVLKAGDPDSAMLVGHRLIGHLKARGVTAVLTALASRTHEQDDTNLQVSTLADTWLHLDYSVLAGERNRTISVVKARGTRHSNQVREVIMDESGVRLADVYVSGGAVLTGTMRLERELEEKRAEREREQQHEERVLALDEETRALETELENLRQRLARRQEDLERLRRQEEARRAGVGESRESVRGARHAGEDPGGQS